MVTTGAQWKEQAGEQLALDLARYCGDAVSVGVPSADRQSTVAGIETEIESLAMEEERLTREADPPANSSCCGSTPIHATH